MPTPAVAVELDDAKIYTMRELNQRTAQVIEEINRRGRPAAVTRNGQFVALITPLLNAKIESLVLSRGGLAAELAQQEFEPHPVTYSADEAARRIRSHYGEHD
jgi:antitoxin (DNA-binding transcriptional repressor) of toxin-antitoxin stability system